MLRIVNHKRLKLSSLFMPQVKRANFGTWKKPYARPRQDDESQFEHFPRYKALEPAEEEETPQEVVAEEEKTPASGKIPQAPAPEEKKRELPRIGSVGATKTQTAKEAAQKQSEEPGKQVQQAPAQNQQEQEKTSPPTQADWRKVPPGKRAVPTRAQQDTRISSLSVSSTPAEEISKQVAGVDVGDEVYRNYLESVYGNRSAGQAGTVPEDTKIGIRKYIESELRRAEDALDMLGKAAKSKGLPLESDEHYKEAQRIKANVYSAREHLRKARKEAHQVLQKHLTNKGSAWRLDPRSNLSDSHKQQVLLGLKFLGIVDSSVLKSDEDADIRVHSIPANQRQRSHINSQGINMSLRGAITDFIHEFGHHMENSVPGLREAARQFREDRIKGEKPVPLTSVLPHRNFASSEEGVKDDWEKLFGADAYYVGKVYDNIGSKDTEIVSMGLEKLYSDPIGFAQVDPDYFHFMVKVCRGGFAKKGAPLLGRGTRWTVQANLPSDDDLGRSQFTPFTHRDEGGKVVAESAFSGSVGKISDGTSQYFFKSSASREAGEKEQLMSEVLPMMGVNTPKVRLTNSLPSGYKGKSRGYGVIAEWIDGETVHDALEREGLIREATDEHGRVRPEYDEGMIDYLFQNTKKGQVDRQLLATYLLTLDDVHFSNLMLKDGELYTIDRELSLGQDTQRTPEQEGTYSLRSNDIAWYMMEHERDDHQFDQREVVNALASVRDITTHLDKVGKSEEARQVEVRAKKLEELADSGGLTLSSLIQSAPMRGLQRR